jgi:hypothetical protein
MHSVHVAGERRAVAFPDCEAVSERQSMQAILAPETLRHIGPVPDLSKTTVRRANASFVAQAIAAHASPTSDAFPSAVCADQCAALTLAPSSDVPLDA